MSITIEDFLARCPRCSELLSLDEMGCPVCHDCEAEFERDSTSTMEQLDKEVQLMQETLSEKTEVLIFTERGLRELKDILTKYNSAVLNVIT